MAGQDERTRTSRFLSRILRHHPEDAGITLDAHGWADVEELIQGINKTGKHRIDRALLEEIVRTDEKTRYAFNEDHTKIRANQGHSVPVDVELAEVVPPDHLWHGTAEKSVPAILREGLLPMGRLYVHLSGDRETAKKVGLRHGKPVIFLVDCRSMAEAGYRFYR
ncbi:MAG: RNA 2'-phosphotransferase, partial [Lachnospiraceae bacterium]